MIRYIENANLFDSDTDALVNPVNCKGIMGKGIALEFRKRFPECLIPYKQACENRKLVPGKLLFVRLVVQPDLFGRKRPAIILFPTKDHWRDKSRIEWIEQGLIFLKNNYHEWSLKSLAMPQIGCGLGGLKWEQVKPLIGRYFNDEQIEIEVYLNATKNYNEKSNYGGLDSEKRK